jgi:2-polyprenyl-6-methoxyphenol hydroxylase-like FAD-dependent oxidoreductase
VKRIVQSEILDTLPPDDPRAVRSRRDLRRINAWMRNHSIMTDALKNNLIGHAPNKITELGAGDGKFLLAVAKKLSSRWPNKNATLLDLQKNVLVETFAEFSKHGWHAEAVAADVFDWPQSSEEIVVANLFLHHFENERLAELLRVISERAELFVAIEPRRAPLPLFFSRLLWAIGCNNVTRHDAIVSVRAGFSGEELSALWPDKQNWRLTERRSGLFSHLFVAQKILGSAGVPPAVSGVAPETFTHTLRAKIFGETPKTASRRLALPKPIQIIGGGLAGLTLGIALRKEEIPVAVFEVGNYPRHRVCGEFVSGRGLEILESLGLKEKFLAAGAIEARSSIFFSGDSKSPVRQLPSPALCLSRFVMDKLLADEFQKLGGELRTDARWQNDFSDGIVRASGRQLRPVENGWRWFGLKVHARNVLPAADLEMHVFKNGYVGICKLAGDEVNICGLFRRNGSDASQQNGFDLLRGNLGTILHERLAQADFDEKSFCSVAGLSLKPQRASEKSEVCIGDALTMIPPVTGNGMSLAFESAQLAAGPLAAFSRGEMSWAQAREKIARTCDENFSRRLRWANRLQQFLLSSSLPNPIKSFAARNDWFWRFAFERTR